MSALVEYQNNATISTTERSLPDNTTTSVPKSKTDRGLLSGFVDCVAGGASSTWRVTLYEKVNAGTQRAVESWEVIGGDVLVLPELPPVGEGWDLTCTRTAGADAVVRWHLYLRPVDNPDVNVAQISANTTAADNLETHAISDTGAWDGGGSASWIHAGYGNQIIEQNAARAVKFTLLDAAGSRKTGAAGSILATISYDDQPAAATAGTFGEIDAVDQPGEYYYYPDSTEVNDIGAYVLYLAPNDFDFQPCSVKYQVVDPDVGVEGGNPTSGDIAAAVWEELRAGHNTAGSFGEYVNLLGYLLHGNAVVDNTVHGANGTTTARLRGFTSAAAAAAATDGAFDGADGEVARWTITTDYDGSGQIKTHRLTRTL